MSNKNTNYTNHDLDVNIHDKNINVTGNADIQAKKTASVQNTQLNAGKGVNIKGGNVKIEGSSIISGGNVVIGGGNVVLNGASISSNGDLEINSQTTEVVNKVDLEAAKTKLKSNNLSLADNANLTINTNEYQEEVAHKEFGENATLTVKDKK
ncbi:hypothetical protein [Psittacicella gerlachiana]|uniref:Uncharacterized protein n=1 Tax=Psittacicella gerlachiana TaxID=2028574 RepID=A0A3A1Y4C5_9GAMM|nr:hypothetical protein [Psittacicella gerlachiana]RIY32301.1 hypothetical protein CKF59_07065 [Psittacicella gerlachiana]